MARLCRAGCAGTAILLVLLAPSRCLAQTVSKNDLFEGDIVASWSQVARSYGPRVADLELEIGAINDDEDHDHSHRQLDMSERLSQRWPKNSNGWSEIQYKISDAFDEAARLKILDAFQVLETSGVIRFVPYQEGTTESYMSFISDSTGCWANLGYSSYYKKRKVHLSQPGCMYASVIQHEILHSLGFWHEQSRSDRDDYLNILWDNIKEDKHSQYFKREDENDLGVPYDYGSVMHYWNGAFAKESGLPTMESINPIGAPFGYATGVSSEDIEQLTNAYICESSFRDSPVSDENYCTSDCRCWEGKGGCNADADCQAGLFCVNQICMTTLAPSVAPTQSPITRSEFDEAQAACNAYVDETSCLSHDPLSLRQLAKSHGIQTTLSDRRPEATDKRSLITGGTPISQSNLDWGFTGMVLRGVENYIVGGATAISRKYALTSKGNGARIADGSGKIWWGANAITGSSTTSTVISVTQHDSSNVAVLELEEELPASHPLVQLSKDPNIETDTSYISIAGYGRDENNGLFLLREAQVPVVPLSECPDLKLEPGEHQGELFTRYQGEGIDRDACDYDSGGPLLVWRENNEFVEQAGIIIQNYGEACSSRNTCRKHIDISQVRDWIEEIVGADLPAPTKSPTTAGFDKCDAESSPDQTTCESHGGICVWEYDQCWETSLFTSRPTVAPTKAHCQWDGSTCSTTLPAPPISQPSAAPSLSPSATPTTLSPTGTPTTSSPSVSPSSAPTQNVCNILDDRGLNRKMLRTLCLREVDCVFTGASCIPATPSPTQSPIPPTPPTNKPTASPTLHICDLANQRSNNKQRRKACLKRKSECVFSGSICSRITPSPSQSPLPPTPPTHSPTKSPTSDMCQRVTETSPNAKRMKGACKKLKRFCTFSGVACTRITPSPTQSPVPPTPPTLSPTKSPTLNICTQFSLRASGKKLRKLCNKKKNLCKMENEACVQKSL